MYALGIDVGSTNVKVALVDSEGRLRAAASRGLHTNVEGDLATQDADALLGAVFGASAQAVAEAEADQVATIGVCSQYSSIVGVDSACRPVTPLVMYTDRRGTDHCLAILERHPEAFETWVERHGIPPVGAGLSLAHLLALQLDEPATHEATHRYLEVMDLVVDALTGRAVASQATMFASQLCDNRRIGVTEYDGDLLGMSGVDPSRLPELLPAGEPVAHLAADAADRLGLGSGVVVQAPMNDSHAAAFATGAFRSGATGLMVGTTAVLLDVLEHPATDLEREVLTMPSPLPGHYLVMAENGLAGRPVAHALEEILASPGVDTDAFGELPAAFAASNPGAGGAMFLPWLAGSLSPSSDPGMRGGYIGVGLGTTRADILRATVEGTARNLRWLLPAVAELTGRPTEELTFVGGAARSREWAQTLADVLGVPVRVPAEPDTAVARAVAMVALARLRGEDPGDVSPVAARSFDPDPSATRVHDRMQGAFEEAFSALQPISRRLNQ